MEYKNCFRIEEAVLHERVCACHHPVDWCYMDYNKLCSHQRSSVLHGILTGFEFPLPLLSFPVGERGTICATPHALQDTMTDKGFKSRRITATVLHHLVLHTSLPH
eukprot:1157579-Pelagomonas_calceolata.AAC.1